MITINVLQPIYYKNASIRVFDSNGNLIKELPVKLEKGINEVLYHHGYNASGTYLYSLVIDGAIIETRKMVFGK
jgi:hypothetical protein